MQHSAPDLRSLCQDSFSTISEAEFPMGRYVHEDIMTHRMSTLCL